jgi:nicotinamidase-related amidase
MTDRYLAIIMDMQTDFLRCKPKRSIDKAVQMQKRVMSLAEARGHEIIYVLYGGFGQLTRQYDPNGHKVFEKEDCSIFTDDLVYYLKKTKTSGMIIMGCNASCCVKDSVVDGMQRGYKMIVPKGTLLDDHQPKFRETLKIFKEEGILKSFEELP